MATPPSGPVSFVAWRPRDGVRSSAAALGARHVPETVHLAAKRLGAGCAALVLAAFGGAEMRLVLEGAALARQGARSEEHTSELQSQSNLVCRLLLEKKKT